MKRFNEFINEGVRDKMTPKSKSEIEESLEDMEPFERMMTMFNQQMDDNYMDIKPYYSQEEIDRMIPGYIEITNDIFDIYEKIDHLYQYYNLSVLIRQELKETLMSLPPSEQIQYVHDLEYLGGLYTNQEWAELGKKSSKDAKHIKTFEKFYIKGNTLYHYTSIENAIKIVNDNELKYRRYGMHNKYATTMQISEDYGYISFTENDEYHEMNDTDIPSQCRFVFNISKLEKDYKLHKYDANKDEEDIYLNDNDMDEMDDLDRQHIPYFGDEMEIRIYEEDISLTKYLKVLELSMDVVDEPSFMELIELCEKKNIKFEEDAF